MEHESAGEPTPVPPAPQFENKPRQPRPGITAVFLNADGLRAGWRLLLYAAIVAGFATCLSMLWMFLLKTGHGKFSITNLFLAEVVGFVAAFGAAVVMSFLEHRPIGAYGLPVSIAFGKLFWRGCLFGLAEISLLMALIYTFGGYAFGTLALHGTQIAHWALLWAICLLFVGLFEEFLFRGYSLFTLTSGAGFWPAAVVLSLLFAAVHLQNSGEGLVGVAAVFVVGMLWCFTVRRTGTLWFAVGMHAAYDFGETYLYSVPDSGVLLPGHLSNATLHGPAWLTGGTVGPEASVFDFLILFALFFVIHRLYPANKMPSSTMAGDTSDLQRTSSDANTSFTP
jgi:membrane protease YdiL (CAAX protease family)